MARSVGTCAAQPEKRRSGRDGAITRKRILLAAERLFAKEGYDGASIRDITSAANIDVGIANYHFGSKENLFREVILLRADEINQRRHLLLSNIEIVPYDEACLRAILQSILIPITGTTRSGSKKLANYRRVVAFVANSTIWQKTLMESHYDWIAQELVDKLCAALPEVARTDIYWSASLFLGAMGKAVAQSKDLESLSAGGCRSDDLSEVRRKLVELAVGALLALPRG